MVPVEFVIDIICTMTLGLTQPPTEISTRNIYVGVKGGRCVGLTTLPPSCGDCLEIWEPQNSGTLRPVQACNGTALPFTCTVKHSLLFTVTNKCTIIL